MMRVAVDEQMCSGTGLCTRICPEVFVLEGGYSRVVRDQVPDELVDQVQEAVRLCPLHAIEIVEGAAT